MPSISQEVFLNIINENLIDPSLDKVKMAINDDAAFVYQRGGTGTVHIPTAGAIASITAGNTTYPVTLTERTDTDNSYTLTNLEVAPVRVGYAQNNTAAYTQDESILNDATRGLALRAAREILKGHYHYTSGLYVGTTGSAVVGHAPAATGNRKAITGADLKKALGIMDRVSVPSTDRNLMIDSAMFWQLMDDLGYTSYRDAVGTLGLGAELPDLWGVKVIMMPNVLFTSNAGVVNAIGAAGAATDYATALLVQKSCTSMAMTDPMVFINENDPTLYGTVYSASMMVGGKYRRYDKYGVVPILGVVA